MEQQGKGLILPAVFAVMGTAAGSILAALYPALPLWRSVVFRQGMGLESLHFLHLFGLACLALAVTAASGLSVLGMVGAFGAVFCKGMALGAVLTGLYRDGGAGGLLTSLLFVMPFALGSIVVLLFAAREACTGARWLTGAVLHRTAGEYPLKRYAAAFWLLAAIQLALTAAQYGVLRLYPAFLSCMLQ
ncbi:MAG: hypothetical protein K5695_01760 [Oscillospiraceae bacterium]|nr:hypothetical protein [Oscillospiraceae bacterium]